MNISVNASIPVANETLVSSQPIKFFDVLSTSITSVTHIHVSSYQTMLLSLFIFLGIIFLTVDSVVSLAKMLIQLALIILFILLLASVIGVQVL
jgi:hypothetical protein